MSLKQTATPRYVNGRLSVKIRAYPGIDDHTAMIPDILYKYVAPERIDVLLKKRIRFTQACFLNDPFEFSPGAPIAEQAKLTVLTSVDLKSIHLRKAEDRNRNDLTIVAALFDTNGNFLAGTEKLLQLRLRDETVAGLEQKPPVVIATDFDVKPGGYLVRLVVRDAEGQQITAENAAVQVQ